MTKKRDRKEYMRQWREKKKLSDPDYFRTQSVKHYYIRRDKMTEEEKEKEKERNRKYLKESRRKDPRVHMLADARKRAKQKGLEYNIKKEDIEIPEMCPVLGIPLFVGDGKRIPNSPSLDRIDNSLGYTKENVKVISLRANTLKNDATIEELKLIIKYMEEYLCLGME